MVYNLEELKSICKKNKIKLLLLYGSRAAENNNADSDVDLGLVLENDVYDFKAIINDLMEIFKDSIIDVAILNYSDPVFKFEVISCCKVLFSQDSETFINFYMNTVKQYNDIKKFKVLEDRYLENFIRGERSEIYKCNPPQINKSF